jgi:SAM-dependent methyltransferase
MDPSEDLMIDAYRDDLAYIHDAGFGSFAANAAPVLVEALRRGGVASGLVLDLGCGSGILARELIDAGYDVLGIDISPSMIALARARVPEARFREASLLTAELPPCVAVAAIGQCLNYLFDRTNSERALFRLLQRTYEAIAKGGLFLFDVAGPGRVPGPGPRKTFFEGDGWAVLVTAEEDRRHRRLTRRITSFRKVGDLYRRDQEIHRLRLIQRSDLARRLRRIGFRVRTLSGYGTFKFPAGSVGFLASRP